MIRGPRLVFREFTLEDAPAVHAYASDPEVTRFASWGPNTVADTQAFLADAVAGQTRMPRTGFTLAAD